MQSKQRHLASARFAPLNVRGNARRLLEFENWEEDPWRCLLQIAYDMFKLSQELEHKNPHESARLRWWSERSTSGFNVTAATQFAKVLQRQKEGAAPGGGSNNGNLVVSATARLRAAAVPAAAAAAPSLPQRRALQTPPQG